MERSESRDAPAKALDAVSNAAVDQLGPRLRSAFRGLNEIQRAVAGLMFDLSLTLARNSLDRLADEGPDQDRRVLLD